MNIGVGDKLESEMETSVVNRRGGASHAVGRFFANLAELESFRGGKPMMTQLEGRCVSLTAMACYSGLGNGLNLLETFFAPVRQRDGELRGLSVCVYRELAGMIQALHAEMGLKAHRLRLRDRIFRYVRYAGNHALQRLPQPPFKGLEDYVRWMRGERTISRFLPRSDEADYKSLSGIEPLGVPSLARILSRCATLKPVSGPKKYGWLRLRALRSAAMRQALNHDDVRAPSGEVLTVVHAGREKQGQSWLDYGRYVWRTHRTAGDVKLSRRHQLAGQLDRLIKFCHAHEVTVANEF